MASPQIGEEPFPPPSSWRDRGAWYILLPTSASLTHRPRTIRCTAFCR